MRDEDRMAELERKLHEMVTKIKHPDEKVNEGTSVWSIPNHMLIFIANSIEEN